LQRITKTLSALPNQTEVIVVNDGSRDETAALVSAFGQGVKLISHPINIGYGNALKTGIRAAQYEYVGITDADGTYEVEDIPKLIEKITLGFDMVVGRRANVKKLDSFSKRIFRGLFQYGLRKLVHKKIEDPNSGLRIFRRSTALEVFPFLCGTFSFTTSLTIFFFMLDKFVCYVDTEYALRHGSSKVKIISDSFRTIQLIVQGITYFNPIKFFLFFSILIVLVVCIPAMTMALFLMYTLSLYYMIFGSAIAVLIGLGIVADTIRLSLNNLKQTEL